MFGFHLFKIGVQSSSSSSSFFFFHSEYTSILIIEKKKKKKTKQGIKQADPKIKKCLNFWGVWLVFSNNHFQILNNSFQFLNTYTKQTLLFKTGIHILLLQWRYKYINHWKNKNKNKTMNKTSRIQIILRVRTH